MKSWLNDARELCAKIVSEVRATVKPVMGKPCARNFTRPGASGDVTFHIDEMAERAVVSLVEDFGDIAFYTEDRGLTVKGNPDFLLIIDPIDGTRPAVAGLESCCVSVAVAPFSRETCANLNFGDVVLALVGEMKSGRDYLAEKGNGYKIMSSGASVEPELHELTDYSSVFWSTGFRGRPAEPLITVLGDLIDMTSVKGGLFDLGSATFSIARVVTGEFDLYLDVGQRMADESPAVREMFLKIGNGAILNNYPHDLAAAALVAREAGCLVTDAYGKPLDDYKLLPPRGKGQISSIVTRDPDFHRYILHQIDLGMRRLIERYGGCVSSK